MICGAVSRFTFAGTIDVRGTRMLPNAANENAISVAFGIERNPAMALVVHGAVDQMRDVVDLMMPSGWSRRTSAPF
jgi:hypothetical protein